MLLAVRVDDVAAQAARGDEGRVPGDVAGALEELSRGQGRLDEALARERHLVVREGGPRFEIRAQYIE